MNRNRNSILIAKTSFALLFFLSLLFTGCCLLDYIGYGTSSDTSSDNSTEPGILPPQAALNIDGKKIPNTGEVKVAGGTVAGSGAEGAFTSGRTVTLSPYIIGQCEVTQQLYKAVMNNENPSAKKDDSNPVENLTWFQALAFCNALSVKLKLDPVYYVGNEVYTSGKSANVSYDTSKNGFRLPTEAEWEFAARGGNPKSEVWLFTYAGLKENKDATLKDYAWFTDNSGAGGTQNVKQKKPNALKLYDMTGNVFEMCWDNFAAVQTGTMADPKGTDKAKNAIGAQIVTKGGSIESNNETARITYRGRDVVPLSPMAKRAKTGLRLVRNATK